MDTKPVGRKSRLYYGKLLRGIRYTPAYDNHPASFYVHLRYDDPGARLPKVHYLEAPTLLELLNKIKADGWVIWGKDKLDYACPPENALEYLLMETVLKAEGATDEEIQTWFSLDTPDMVASAPAADAD